MFDKKKCCVVTPVYRSKLQDLERPSLYSINQHLPNYDHFTIVPHSLSATALDLPLATTIKSFSDKFFKSPATYNRLLLSRSFYDVFSDYDYMLIVQLDALVLAARLNEWCCAGWDYIGAPWFVGFRQSESRKLAAVGNGGFSLRKISSLVRMLELPRSAVFDGPMQYNKWWRQSRWDKLKCRFLRLKQNKSTITWEKYLRHFFVGNEDNFWGVCAPVVDAKFKVPDVGEGLKFAFEVHPRDCFEQSGRNMPFGCHAWAKYDKNFWIEKGWVPSKMSNS